MKYGYKRPLVNDEESKFQLHDIPNMEVYTEQHPHMKKRHELDTLVMKLTKGDQLYVQNFVVLADSLTQFQDLLRVFERDEVTVTFIDEDIKNSDILTMKLIELIELLTDLQTKIKRHQSIFGVREAQKQGKVIGRPKKSDDNLNRAFIMYDSKEYTLQQIKDETGISKSTLYRYLDQFKHES
ncbi:Resolvase, N terminal domain [Psychrobacillus sp. OK028]|uniref:helix-turn-helix domain-containing protein n=1 Tax=Psychrobacillus sp. OK028 TaxID=1884359 RepID=UPI00088C6DEE|nr:helix-turn-helix domain-containing protein [Psychrobacillus sp. OK028]SDN10119.1 Resolvase, N terminal domain [Psychrobacillus sp. OK028]